MSTRRQRGGGGAVLYDVIKFVAAAAAAEKSFHGTGLATIHKLKNKLCICNVLAFVGLYVETTVIGAHGKEVGG